MKQRKRIVFLFIVLATLIFSTMEVALKIVGVRIDPLQMTFFRFFLGGAFLLPFGVSEMRRKGRPDTKLLLYQLMLGVVCVPVSMVMFQFGVLYCSAATAAVIFCSNPIFTVFFAHFLNRNDRLTPFKLWSIVPAVAGIVFMIKPWDVRPEDTILGALLSVGAALTFSLYSTLSARTVQRSGVWAQTSVSFLFGAAALLAVMLPLGVPVFTGFTENIPIILYVSVGVTGLGYLLYFLSIQKSNATTSSLVFFFKPVIAPVFAVILLGESIAWNMYIGIALMLFASYLIMFDKQSR
jgi:drug/metabolite transporter (DMT)-like permease